MHSEARITEQSTLRNTTDRSLTLILEPWANEYCLPPGSELVIEGEGPIQDCGFGITQDGDQIVVWAWRGSDARILHANGRLCADWTGQRVPEGWS